MTETLDNPSPSNIIDQLRPDHHKVDWNETGDNRIVAFVDDQETWHFPREPKDPEAIEANTFEFEVAKLLETKNLGFAVPRPIEIAEDGSYTILSYLPGIVLSKKAVTELSAEKRQDLGLGIARALNDLNSQVSYDEIRRLPGNRTINRDRDEHYKSVYQQAQKQTNKYSQMYIDAYERLAGLTPDGSEHNIIVFGDFSSPNIVLDDQHRLSGLIDWTELGMGNIHNELRPVFSVIGQEATEAMIQALDPRLGPVDLDLIKLKAIIHELSILVSGKQTGQLTPEREQLALDSVNQWLSPL